MLFTVMLFAISGTAQRARDTFVLSGTVVNSVTGEPIARALVRASGQASRVAFTDGEGRFEFEGLPAGQIILMAQKPGYFNQTDFSAPAIPHVMLGPNTGAQIIKLAPQSAIHGRVTDGSGQAIEGISVRLSGRSLRDGRMTWEQRGATDTDDDGHFRFANLMPGTYYLAAGPSQGEGRLLAAGEKPTTGFPRVYYPGVPELNSAAPLQLGAGQQLQADFSLSAVPVYHVSGTTSGPPEHRPIAVMAFTTSGEQLPMGASSSRDLGTFSFDALPAGTYILKAVTNLDQQQLYAEQRVTVTSNVDNVHLALAPAITISVVVHLQSRAASGTGESTRPGFSISAPNTGEGQALISVKLVSTEPNAQERYSYFEPRDGRNLMLVQNVNPGNYTVKLTPQAPWYVASASYGQTNVLYDDITVATVQSYPLDIVLRDDSASLALTVKGVENAASGKQAAIIIMPQGGSKVAPHVLNGISHTYMETGLAPGEYLVYAFDRLDNLEYANPDALAPYASQAAHITLTANQSAQVTLDPIQIGKEQ